MNKYYIQRISAETCEDIIKKYQPKKQEDIIIIRTYDEPLGRSPKLRFAMSEEEYENFVKLIGSHGEFVDIIDIIIRRKEAQIQDKIVNGMAEENKQ